MASTWMARRGFAIAVRAYRRSRSTAPSRPISTTACPRRRKRPGPQIRATLDRVLSRGGTLFAIVDGGSGRQRTSRDVRARPRRRHGVSPLGRLRGLGWPHDPRRDDVAVLLHGWRRPALGHGMARRTGPTATGSACCAGTISASRSGQTGQISASATTSRHRRAARRFAKERQLASWFCAARDRAFARRWLSAVVDRACASRREPVEVSSLREP